MTTVCAARAAPNRISPLPRAVNVSNWRGARYPWEQWFGRGSFTVVRGEDFHCTVGGMVVNTRVAARRLGLRVRVSVGDDRLTITVKQPDRGRERKSKGGR